MTAAGVSATVLITWRGEEKRIDITALRKTAIDTAMALLKLQGNPPGRFSIRQKQKLRKKIREGGKIVELLTKAIESPHETPNDFVVIADKIRSSTTQTYHDVQYQLHEAQRELERASDTLKWTPQLRETLELLREISDYAEQDSSDWVGSVHGGPALAYE